MSTNDPNDPTDHVVDTDTFHQGLSSPTISAGNDGNSEDEKMDTMAQKEANDDDVDPAKPNEGNDKHIVTPADQEGTSKPNRMHVSNVSEVEIMNADKTRLAGMLDASYDQNDTQPMQEDPEVRPDAKLRAKDLGRASEDDTTASVDSRTSVTFNDLQNILDGITGLTSRIDGLSSRIEEIQETKSPSPMPRSELNAEQKRQVDRKVKQYLRVVVENNIKYKVNQKDLEADIADAMDGSMFEGLPESSRPETRPEHLAPRKRANPVGETKEEWKGETKERRAPSLQQERFGKSLQQEKSEKLLEKETTEDGVYTTEFMETKEDAFSTTSVEEMEKRFEREWEEMKEKGGGDMELKKKNLKKRQEEEMHMYVHVVARQEEGIEKYNMIKKDAMLQKKLASEEKKKFEEKENFEKMLTAVLESENKRKQEKLRLEKEKEKQASEQSSHRIRSRQMV